MKNFLLALLMVLASTVFTLAQTSTGRLVGTVSGPDGVIPGASVEVKDDITGKVVNLTTNDDGSFAIPAINVGSYTVTVKAQGFKTYTATSVKIDIAREYALNAALEIGTIEEVVTVNAGSDIVNSTNAEVSNTVTQKEILELPLNGRNPLSLVGLQAGNNAAGISGARTSSTNYTRDGINVQDVYIRNGFVADTPTTDNTGEFTVTTATAGVESGFGASQVQLSTPRGGREFHGALFAYNRNSAFTANNFFSNRQGKFVATDAAVIQGRATIGEDRQPRPFLNRNQYGGKVSGPVPLPFFGEGTPYLLKNKAFFFFSTERFDLRQQVSKVNTVLTPDARNGIFSYRPTSAPAAGQCITFTNGICRINILNGQGLRGPIPASQQGALAADPIILNRFISPLPAGNRTDVGDGLNTIGYAFNQSDPETRREYTFRGDGEINDKNSVSFTYRFNRTTDARTDIDNSFSPVALSETDAPVKFFRAGWVNTTSNLTNELNYGFQLAPVGFFNRNLPSTSAFVGLNIISNVENSFRDQGRESNFWTIRDSASYVTGNHTFRFGGDYQRYTIETFGLAGVGIPTFNISGTGNPNTPRLDLSLFPGGATGGGITNADRGTADALRYLLGGIIGSGNAAANATSQTSGYVVGAPNIRNFRYDVLAFFAGDTWRVRPNLTLNLGLRYERYSPLEEENGLFLEPVVANNDAVGTLFSQTGTIDFVGRNSGKANTFAKPDNNNIGGTASFAYSFGGKGFLKRVLGDESKSILRGGFRLGYVNDEYIRSQENALANNAGLTNTALALQNGSANLNARLSVLPSLTAPNFVQPPFSFANQLNNVPFAAGSNAILSVIDPNFQVQRQYDYNFGYTRQFGGNSAIEFRYVGTRSNSMVRTIDFGQVDLQNNGYGADFARAFNNYVASGGVSGGSINGNAACLASGACRPLTVISRLPAASQSFIQTNIGTGAAADIAASLISSGTAANPTAFTGSVPFLSNPRFSPLNLLLNGGRFNYNALQIEYRQRLTQGLSINANYSYQKILTDVQDDGVNQTRVSPYLDNNNKEYNYSRPSYDISQIFNLTALYDLPIGKGRFINTSGIADFFLGGWNLGSVVQIYPRPPVLFLDATGTLNRTARSGFQTATTNLTNDQIKDLLGVREVNGIIYYIDPAVISSSGRGSDGLLNTFQGQVFFNNRPNTTGNIQRYNINGTLYWNWDASLQKSFRVTEGTKFVVRAEAFNVTNSTRFGNPNTNINSTTFGRITTASSPRIMQFGARFEF